MRNRFSLSVVFLLFCVKGWTQDVGDRTIFVRSVAPKQTGGPIQQYGITRDDVRMIQSLVPTIQTLVPVRFMPAQLVRVGKRSATTMITGTTDVYARGKDIEILRGRFLVEKDLKNRNNVAVLDATTAKTLFPIDDPIGKAVQSNNEYFTVVGVYEHGLRPPKVFIPYTTMRSRLGDRVVLRKAGVFEVRQYELSEVEIVMHAKANVAKTVEIIRNVLKKGHSQKDYEVNSKL